MSDGLTRREFLKLTSAGAAGLVFGWAAEGCGEEEMNARFFTPHQRATVQAATARILPSDNEAGAREAGVVDYIDRLLAAFDEDPPLIFAGGPFSGRGAAHQAGAPFKELPGGGFRRFLTLSRVKELAWRVRLFGSKGTPGSDFNDAELGPTVGLRDVYRRGVEALDAKSRELSGRDFVDLAPEEQDKALMEGDQEFVRQLAEHTVEGMYAAPEYGGNKDSLGWASIKFEGDRQPMGYSMFDPATNSYREHPEAPVSGPNPDEGFAGFDEDVSNLIGAIVTAVGGQRFF